MKIGDRIQIKGRLGFLMNPIMVVLDRKENKVLIQSENAKEGGLLSNFNSHWHDVDLLKYNIIYE